MIPFTVILYVSLISYYFSDVHSEKFVQSVLMPSIFALSLAAMVIWLCIKFRNRLKNSGLDDVGDSGLVSSGSGSDFGGGSDGGDD